MELTGIDMNRIVKEWPSAAMRCEGFVPSGNEQPWKGVDQKRNGTAWICTGIAIRKKYRIVMEMRIL